MGEPRLSTERVRELLAAGQVDAAIPAYINARKGDACPVCGGFDAPDLGRADHHTDCPIPALLDVYTAGRRALTERVDDLAADLIDARAELARQRAEISSLRASLGEANGSEPVGCPTPGMCGCVASRASKG